MSAARQHEYEFEPQYGLPERLPAGEHILWQGVPDWRAFARHVFHVNKLLLYFSAILALRAAIVIGDGGSAAEAARSLIVLAPLFAFCIGCALAMGWLAARTSAYTITDKRVVMRVGIVLGVTFNLPFSRIEGASLHELGHGLGDIAIATLPEDRIAYLHMWPHMRPWRFARTEPMLRCVPDAARVAGVLAQAWTRSTGVASPSKPQGVAAPERNGGDPQPVMAGR